MIRPPHVCRASCALAGVDIGPRTRVIPGVAERYPWRPIPDQRETWLIVIWFNLYARHERNIGLEAILTGTPLVLRGEDS